MSEIKFAGMILDKVAAVDMHNRSEELAIAEKNLAAVKKMYFTKYNQADILDYILDKINNVGDVPEKNQAVWKASKDELEALHNDLVAILGDAENPVEKTEVQTRIADRIAEIENLLNILNGYISTLMDKMSGGGIVDDSEAITKKINKCLARINKILISMGMDPIDISNIVTDDVESVDDIDETAPEHTHTWGVNADTADVQEIIDSFNSGVPVVVDKNLEYKGSVIINNDAEIDFNGHSLTTAGDERGSALVIESGNVTLKNMTVKYKELETPENPFYAGIIVKGGANVTLENVNCHEEMPLVIYNNTEDTATVTVNSGDFTTETGSQSAYIVKGNSGGFIINGGKFGGQTWTNGVNYTLNCSDGVFNQRVNDGTYKDMFVVKGGEFVDFNPSNSKAEPAHEQSSQLSWVAEGYHVENDGNVYKVVQD